jgi:membrane-associated HD superfamily phosphohydrolase
MIADSCEAAVRSMPDKSPQNVRAKIDQIIKDRISDGQFDECNITMQELNRVAEEFTNALSGVHHQRIEYPDLKKALQDNKERESANANRADK